MFLLSFFQEGVETKIALFETLEEGRAFVAKLPGYESKKEAGFCYEYLDPALLPSYVEIEFQGHLFPLTKFMFDAKAQVEIVWQEIPNLSQKGRGMVEGLTKVDAYVIENKDVREYISKREAQYEKVKYFLETKNFTVARDFPGSEDGEAIIYRKNDEEDWHFLIHMDPLFVEEENIESTLKGMISN